MKTKEQIYVKINNLKEAKDAKRILKALGENIRENYFNDRGETILWCFENEWVVAYDYNVAETEVTLKELIEIIVSEKPKAEDKPKSILDGKVAIQVNNEREFKLLMEHFESKGWILSNGRKPTDQKFSGKFYTYYKDRSDFNYTEATKYCDATIIPFSDFAKEIGIEVPKFIIRSEDGVDLYVGDNYYHLWCTDRKWIILADRFRPVTEETSLYIGKASDKVFYSKEKAQEFCDKMNKPKEVEVHLYFGGKATVKANSGITIRDASYGNITLSHGDIVDIQNAINKLK